MLPHPIPTELAELMARRLRIAGEPTRILLLDALRDGEQTVNDLAAKVGACQQSISKHLTILAEAGMLTRRKDHNHVYYRIVDHDALALCDEACRFIGRQARELAHLVGADS